LPSVVSKKAVPPAIAAVAMTAPPVLNFHLTYSAGF
jgi:hypothetical protein